MKVSELIEKLKHMPPDGSVGYVWDGEVRNNVEVIWLARNGEVVLADWGCVVYSTDSRPDNAPDEKADPYWQLDDPGIR